ncbi:MAG: dicarboxylate/amino acid:cation symporter [Chitinophagaceae bacterium]
MLRISTHWIVLISLAAGILAGILLASIQGGSAFAIDWIKPLGNIYLNLLKLLAVPLIITSLIKGIADLKGMTNLSKIGKKTLQWYIITTLIAVTLGLTIANIIKPGKFISPETRTMLMSEYTKDLHLAENKPRSNIAIMHYLESMVPENIFNAVSNNANMLQVIIFTLLFSIGLLMAPRDKTTVIRGFFEDVNEVIMQMIRIIMKATPVGVFSLMVSLVTEAPAPDIFGALAIYMLTVLLGLCILLYVIYPLLVKFIGKSSPMNFLKGMMPAQLVAFTTSSAAATLPVTMKCIKENLHVNEEVANFVVPVGATINMDGTTLYQAIAAIFIAQATGIDLSFSEQLTVIITASLAGFGSAAVPGAGILMLMIVLQSIHIDPQAIALLFAVDRPLDMCRTVVNVSGDGMIATVINRKMQQEA